MTFTVIYRTWLIGSHDGIWAASKKAPVRTRQYVLRSEDRGKTWQLLPKERPGGWYLERIHIFLGQHGRQLLYVHFNETDLAKLPTKAALMGRIEESSPKREVAS